MLQIELHNRRGLGRGPKNEYYSVRYPFLVAASADTNCSHRKPPPYDPTAATRYYNCQWIFRVMVRTRLWSPLT